MPGALWFLPLIALPALPPAPPPDLPAVRNTFVTLDAFTPVGALYPCFGVRITRTAGPFGVEASVGAPASPVLGVADLSLLIAGGGPRSRLILRGGVSALTLWDELGDPGLGAHVGVSYLAVGANGHGVRLDATVRLFPSAGASVPTIGVGYVFPLGRGRPHH